MARPRRVWCLTRSSIVLGSPLVVDGARTGVVVAAASDWLDGHIAKNYHQTVSSAHVWGSAPHHHLTLIVAQAVGPTLPKQPIPSCLSWS